MMGYMKNKSLKIQFNLSAILAEKELSQRKAADMTGISKNGISVLAGEPKQIQIETLEKLCNGLNVSPSDLFVVGEKSKNV